MSQWLRQTSQVHECPVHDLKEMGSTPGRGESEVCECKS